MRKLIILLSILVIGTLLLVLFTSNKTEVTKIDVDTLKIQLKKEGRTLIDVRETDEYSGGHIEGAVNAPLSSLDAVGLPYEKDEPIYLICHSGNRSAVAAQILSDHGYTEVYDVTGGMIAWEQR
ncbi:MULTISPECIES: rhodanese-like domain-containing protein [Exiguobacterium]|uniref:rhodanese-like domain-containing protein n=1 Tax=Exiguobacterium TaxID=33986 RepID=UPI001BE660BE|nr:MULTISPECIES: rhodanese-like domain-containing protein [Exiguobacterium]MCT4783901.1 rhodanese-like domain-containing protein [Exiguobacterium himgiriensis]